MGGCASNGNLVANGRARTVHGVMIITGMVPVNDPRPPAGCAQSNWSETQHITPMAKKQLARRNSHQAPLDRCVTCEGCYDAECKGMENMTSNRMETFGDGQTIGVRVASSPRGAVDRSIRNRT